MTLPEDLKLLFVQWLQDLAVEATNKGSKMALTYNRAFMNVKNHPEPVNDPKTLKSIRFVGDKTVVLLTTKLKKYCESLEVAMPNAFAANESIVVANKRKSDSSGSEPAKKPRKKRPYVPKHRSGGFAILLALYLRDRVRNGLGREDIVKAATPYSDKSFSSNPAANDFYSAWSSIKVLMNNDLVSCSGRSPKLYFLTDEGLELARQLKDTEGMHSSPLRQEPDISFDNKLRVTPDTSNIRFSDPYNLIDVDDIDGSNAVEKLDITIDTVPGISSCPLKTGSRSSTDVSAKLSIEALPHDSTNRIFDGTRYDIWTQDEVEVIIIIDSREVRSSSERDFFEKRLSSFGVKCEVRALSVGDIVWIAKHKKTGKEVVLNHICERKRIDDLAFSIRDGRFQEQKNRLKKTGMKNYYYLIEEAGMGVMDRVAEMAESIQTAISMTITVSDFYLRRFKEINETVSFLASLTQVIQNNLLRDNTKLVVIRAQSLKNQTEYTELVIKFRDKFETRNTSYECVHYYPVFQELMGKSVTTVREMFIVMLMSIRGVSLERAIVIQRRFPTPKSLIEFYTSEHGSDTEEEKKRLLEYEFRNEIGNKKIGKVCSERVYDAWGKQ
ncbi:hypothetical protein G9P44_005836 [Scheffersomyces stipitis]|nr:hypothetical protein G9P44_005836 [Scheffersomyces stipitis]